RGHGGRRGSLLLCDRGRWWRSWRRLRLLGLRQWLGWFPQRREPILERRAHLLRVRKPTARILCNRLRQDRAIQLQPGGDLLLDLRVRLTRDRFAALGEERGHQASRVKVGRK